MAMDGPHPAGYTGLTMLDDADEYRLTRNGRTNDLPGIGNISGQLLADQGYEHTYNVLGMFLQLNMDEELFDAWLEEVTTTAEDAVKCTKENRTKCYTGLAQYCRKNL